MKHLNNTPKKVKTLSSKKKSIKETFIKMEEIRNKNISLNKELDKIAYVYKQTKRNYEDEIKKNIETYDLYKESVLKTILSKNSIFDNYSVWYNGNSNNPLYHTILKINGIYYSIFFGLYKNSFANFVCNKIDVKKFYHVGNYNIKGRDGRYIKVPKSFKSVFNLIERSKVPTDRNFMDLMLNGIFETFSNTVLVPYHEKMKK